MNSNLQIESAWGTLVVILMHQGCRTGNMPSISPRQDPERFISKFCLPLASVMVMSRCGHRIQLNASDTERQSCIRSPLCEIKMYGRFTDNTTGGASQRGPIEKIPSHFLASDWQLNDLAGAYSQGHGGTKYSLCGSCHHHMGQELQICRNSHQKS